MISGLPRVGKTALATALAVDRMVTSRYIISCKRQLKKMNNLGFNYDIPKEHLVFSDYFIESRKPNAPRRRNHDIDGFKFALPNPLFETSFEPPYSLIVLDEAQKYYNSRRRVSDYVSRKYEMHGHNNLDIILCCLRIGQIDLNVRAHAGLCIQVLNLQHEYNKYDEIIKSTWSGLAFNSSYQAERYRENGNKEDIGEPFEYTFEGNIFSCYNSFNHRAVHYNQNYDKQFDIKEGIYSGLSLASMQNYNAAHKIKAPKGFYEEK
jgi:hypothetical protein